MQDPGTTQPVRRATPADLPAIREVVRAAYARYLDRMDRHLPRCCGYRETGRRAEDGYRRVYMEKDLR
jgi:hypothetical protein